MEISIVVNGISYDFPSEEEMITALRNSAYQEAETDEEDGVYRITD